MKSLETLRGKVREIRYPFGAVLGGNGRKRQPGTTMKGSEELHSSTSPSAFLNRWPGVRVTPGALPPKSCVDSVLACPTSTPSPGIKPLGSGRKSGNSLRVHLQILTLILGACCVLALWIFAPVLLVCAAVTLVILLPATPDEERRWKREGDVLERRGGFRT